MADKGTLADLFARLSKRAPSREELAAEVARRQPMDRRPATIRAGTRTERFSDTLRDILAAAAEQPVGRVTDALGLTGFDALANEPPPDLSIGMMPDRPGAKLGDIIKGLSSRRVLYHSSPGRYQGGKLPFSAYYGTKNFAKAFPDEFGPNLYALRPQSGARVLDIASPDASAVRDAMATQQWGAPVADLSPDDIYELWADKALVMEAIHKLGLDDAFDMVKYGEEYIVPSRTIATSRTRRVK